MARHIPAPIHAAKILLRLPSDEYRPAIARMAAILRGCVGHADLPSDEVKAARALLVELEQRLR